MHAIIGRLRAGPREVKGAGRAGGVSARSCLRRETPGAYAPGSPAAGILRRRVRAMITTVEAIYQDGVFKPVRPVDLPENQRVKVVVEVEESPRRGVPVEQVLGM